MNLEQVKQRKEQLEKEVSETQVEIDNLSLDKAKLDQQSQILQEKIVRKDSSISSKREEITRLSTAIEIMER